MTDVWVFARLFLHRKGFVAWKEEVEGAERRVGGIAREGATSGINNKLDYDALISREKVKARK